MKHIYTNQVVFISTMFFLSALVASCKKNISPETLGYKPLATLGLYEYASDQYKRLLVPITQIGAITVEYYSIFDTGSTGMTIDADGILPASMITDTGLQFKGDSINVSGITVTNKTATIIYGDKTSSTYEYGNLAYGPVTIGNANGKITTKRIPFFLYYKVTDGNGKQFTHHSSDVFGVGPGISYVNSEIGSPLSYFDMPAGVVNGFKLAMLGNTGFTGTGTYVSGLLTLGLVPDQLASSSGFIMHPLSYFSLGGYSSNIPATVTYNGTTVAAQILFDTGTPSVTIIEDKAANAIGALPVNSVVTVITNQGFKYQYTTTSTANLTAIQNPMNTADSRTIFSLDFFISNEYMLDYTNHRIGLKNN